MKTFFDYWVMIESVDADQLFVQALEALASDPTNKRYHHQIVELADKSADRFDDLVVRSRPYLRPGMPVQDMKDVLIAAYRSQLLKQDISKYLPITMTKSPAPAVKPPAAVSHAAPTASADVENIVLSGKMAPGVDPARKQRAWKDYFDAMYGAEADEMFMKAGPTIRAWDRLPPDLPPEKVSTMRRQVGPRQVSEIRAEDIIDAIKRYAIENRMDSGLVSHALSKDMDMLRKFQTLASSEQLPVPLHDKMADAVFHGVRGINLHWDKNAPRDVRRIGYVFKP